METTRYSKLVRDKIPEFLSERGKICRTRILSQGAYLQKLDEKLQEELSEFLESHAIEELADLCEVIRAVAAARGWEPETLERVRSKKWRNAARLNGVFCLNPSRNRKTVMTKLKSVSGSVAEDLFIELFSEAFGAENAQYLYSQYPFYDIYQNSRYADFLLKIGNKKIAFEIDDEATHNRAVVASEKFYDDLLKQNSMVYFGWGIYGGPCASYSASRKPLRMNCGSFWACIRHLRLWTIICRGSLARISTARALNCASTRRRHSWHWTACAETTKP